MSPLQLKTSYKSLIYKSAVAAAALSYNDEPTPLLVEPVDSTSLASANIESGSGALGDWISSFNLRGKVLLINIIKNEHYISIN